MAIAVSINIANTNTAPCGIAQVSFCAVGLKNNRPLAKVG